MDGLRAAAAGLVYNYSLGLPSFPMKPDFSQPRVVIRPTLPSDTPDVLEFCKRIWDGHDYVPLVWEAWLADQQGAMFTAEYAGHAVGFTRLVRLAPGQWWLEGFRVDPQHQDKKIGSQLHKYAINWWLEHGEGVIRLWTNAKRVKVHHLCEQTGFAKTQERATYTCSPLPENASVTAFSPLAEENIPAALDFSLAASSLPVTGGLFDLGWRLADLGESLLRDLMKWPGSRLLWWRERQGLICTWEDDEDGLYPLLALVACETDDLPALLLDFRRYAAEQGYHKVDWNAYLSPELDALLTAAGFARVDDEANFQFERIHPMRSVK
jgi:GNAT superfamily N-acetyltransferase